VNLHRTSRWHAQDSGEQFCLAASVSHHLWHRINQNQCR
jgi:hypothetical protein